MSSPPQRPSVTADPRDRDLVRLHWPAELRPAFDALLDIDEAMADVLARATQPALAAIKLAWWRERLEELDQQPPPAEPRLQAAARELLPRGLSGAALSSLEESWALLLMEDQQAAFMRGVALRGTRLFELAVRLLGITMNDRLQNSAQCFSAADLGRRAIIDLVPLKRGKSQDRVPRRERPLTMFEALARRDMRSGGPPFEPEATPWRAWTLFGHRLTGRL
ncbi:MAG: hypothetical protein M3438_03240 [Pseudomonadota bacterium]|nr:hypothetical protein [Sphingomonas sp.]MDQ3478161.1 hypothetical protein [Pseudomonadota bacterium]